MSEPITTAGTGTPAIDPETSVDALFASVMDTLAPGAYGETDGEGAASADTAAAGAGQPAPAAEGAGAGSAAAAAQAAGGGGIGGVPQPGTADDGAGPGEDGARPASWTVDPGDLEPRWGEVTTALEKRAHDGYVQESLTEVQTEYAKYFEALGKHPRLLIGSQVPRLDGQDGTETLRDSADAKEWQEAVKGILLQEVQDRASRRSDENNDMMALVHSSIDLFKNNTDLIPGTKTFDVELANEFADFAKDYELRVDGKLYGYSVPVQPIINRLRAKLVEQRAQAAAAPAPKGVHHRERPGGAPAGVAPAAPAPAPEQPQAGIPSKQGNGADPAETFETLFGTIGLPNLRI